MHGVVLAPVICCGICSMRGYLIACVCYVRVCVFVGECRGCIIIHTHVRACALHDVQPGRAFVLWPACLRVLLYQCVCVLVCVCVTCIQCVGVCVSVCVCAHARVC